MAESRQVSKQGVLVSVFLLVPLAALLIGTMWSADLKPFGPVSEEFGGVREVGRELFQSWLYPFEILSLLILAANRLDGRLKAAKRLKAAARVLLCQPPPMRQIEGWIQTHGREALGLQVVPRAAQALRARVGEDLGSLDAALRRLASESAEGAER